MALKPFETLRALKLKFTKECPIHGSIAINLDDPFAPLWRKLAGERRCWTFGLDHTADVSAEDLVLGETHTFFTLKSPQGSIAVHLPLLGRHIVLNALAAATMALAMGLL